MTTTTPPSPRSTPASLAAVAELYHRFLTGSLLALVVRQGTDRAARVVFTIFRTQHLDLFEAGLGKLELQDLPDAVACAKYHVLSNSIGGVDVGWIPESDSKSWVRYRPPRWIFDGTAVCGIPSELSRAMLRGWHGHNGVTLGNPRLGFVCTMQTTDGQPGLEGYYIEEAYDLDVDQRVRFRPGQRPPGPVVDLPLPSWEPDRLAKAERNYASAYVRNLLLAMPAELGPADALGTGLVAARQIGMQFAPRVMAMLGADSTASFGQRLGLLLAAQGDEVEVEPDGAGEMVTARSWRLLAGADAVDPSAFEVWNGLWEGLAAMEDRRLLVTSRLDLGDDATRWRVLSR